MGISPSQKCVSQIVILNVLSTYLTTKIYVKGVWVLSYILVWVNFRDVSGVASCSVFRRTMHQPKVSQPGGLRKFASFYNLLYQAFFTCYLRTRMTASTSKGSEMDLDQVPSLWRNKPVQFECNEPGELFKIHLIAVYTTKLYICWNKYPIPRFYS